MSTGTGTVRGAGAGAGTGPGGTGEGRGRADPRLLGYLGAAGVCLVGTLIGQDTASPFEVTWSEVPAGNYALTAVAVDTRGASTISSAVNVAVKLRGGKGKSPKR